MSAIHIVRMTDDTPTLLHMGLIPDGNRRWSRANGVPFDGVTQLSSQLTDLFVGGSWKLHESLRSRVKEVTIYVMSRDNVSKRNDGTCRMILDLLSVLRDLLVNVPSVASSVRFRFVGERELLSVETRRVCEDIERLSTGDFSVTMGLAYDPVLDSQRVLSGSVPRRTDIDLVLRSGGEHRSSGFFPMQTLYSEWVYNDKMFPDITLFDVEHAIAEFDRRQRRFGA